MAIFPNNPVPLTIASASNCLFWIRPQDTSASNMTFSGGRLSAIKNLANNRILASNAVTANQPSTGVVTIGGLNALGFDNDNNRWLGTGLTATLTNFTFFCVFQKDVNNSVGIISSCGTIRPAFNNLGYTAGDGATTLTCASGVSTLTEPAIFALTCDLSTLTRNGYKNSPTIAATAAYNGSTTSPNYLGTVNPTSGAGRGGFNLGETIIYNKVLSADEITTIMRYLANSSGVILT